MIMKHQILLLTEDLKKDIFIILLTELKTSWHFYCLVGLTRHSYLLRHSLIAQHIRTG